MTDKIQVTNEDKSRKLALKARTELLKSASRDWSNAEGAVKDAACQELKALNLLRTCGLKLQEAAGHEQISFEFFRGVAADLPKNMSLKGAKFCIHLARTFDGAIATLDEARSARQMMFEAFGTATAPKRIGPQIAHEANPWSDFVSGAASLTTLFDDLEADAMERWTPDKLSTFISTTQPIADAHARAKQLAEKGAA